MNGRNFFIFFGYAIPASYIFATYLPSNLAIICCIVFGGILSEAYPPFSEEYGRKLAQFVWGKIL